MTHVKQARDLSANATCVMARKPFSAKEAVCCNEVEYLFAEMAFLDSLTWAEIRRPHEKTEEGL